MRRWAFGWNIIAVLGVGCTGTHDAFENIHVAEVEARDYRGTVQALSGSCINACGAKSDDGNCWCDSMCEQYGDCCADKQDFCTPEMGDKKPTCEEACGGKSQNGNCWCDEQCMEYGDCCSDKHHLCDADVCPPFECDVICLHGNALDENGCQLCECVPPPTCNSDSYCNAVCAGEEPPVQHPSCPLPACQCVPECPSGPEWSYVSEDTSVCAVIKFTCEEDSQPFSNSCGCGCMKVLPPPADSCQGACGDASANGSCYCDGLCTMYGDCCADVEVWCADRQVAGGQCVRSRFDACTTDADCAVGGCGGDLCHNPAEGLGITTCDCAGPGSTVGGCGCVNGTCAWYL